MTERLPSTNLTDQNVAAVWKTLKEMFTLTRILSTIWILKTAQFDVVNVQARFSENNQIMGITLVIILSYYQNKGIIIDDNQQTNRNSMTTCLLAGFILYI